jgi:probable HAF family extracellular repeat protein
MQKLSAVPHIPAWTPTVQRQLPFSAGKSERGLRKLDPFFLCYYFKHELFTPLFGLLDRLARFFCSIAAALGTSCLYFAMTTAWASTVYEVAQIPTPPDEESLALGINAAGDVVGYRTEGNEDHAFFYSYATGSVSDLGSLGGKTTVARAVNEARQVTGFATDAANANKAFVLSPDHPMTALPGVSADVSSQGFAIDPAGKVAGVVESARGQLPVIFVDGTLKNLAEPADSQEPPLCTAYGLNPAGDAVGVAKPFGGSARAFFYSMSQSRFSDLGTLGGKSSQAFALNRGGDIVGEAETNEGKVHAFLYTGGKMSDLGTLVGFETQSSARAINDDGLVVGFSEAADKSRHAFVTEGSQLVDLNTLAGNLNEAGFVSLDEAYGVNARGWVVGYGTTVDGKGAAFVAVPKSLEASTSSPSAKPKADSYDAIYTQLSSKDGEWREAGAYGHVFRPKIAANSGDWRPYRDGHWLNTDNGWYWESSESFAWATYHYGGWISIEGVGWCWVPGRHWAPSWVSWRQGDDCVGWAPLPPEAVCVEGNRVEVTPSCDASYGIGPGAYTFIGYNKWSLPSYAEVCYSNAQIFEVIQQTTNVTHISVEPAGFHSYGLDPAFLAEKLGKPIPRVGLAVAPTIGLSAAYQTALWGNTLHVAVPGLHLAPTATVRPPIEVRINDPHPERGWAGVPATRLATLSAALGQSRLKRPAPVPGGREPSVIGFLRSSKPFAVPQPINIPTHASVVGSPQRHVRILGDQSFSAQLAKAVRSGAASRHEPAPPSAGSSQKPSSLAEKPEPRSGQYSQSNNGVSSQPTDKAIELASPHGAGSPVMRREEQPGPKRSHPVEEHRLEHHLANAEVHKGSQSPTHGHATVHEGPQNRQGSRPTGAGTPRPPLSSRSFSRAPEPKAGTPQAIVHTAPPRPVSHPKPTPHH